MVGDYKKNTLPSHVRVLDTTHQMFHVSVQKFKEYVRLSHSWSELARRCGQPTKFGRLCSARVVKVLKAKVLFLKLDTEHFGKCARASEADEAGEAGEGAGMV